MTTEDLTPDMFQNVQVSPRNVTIVGVPGRRSKIAIIIPNVVYGKAASTRIAIVLEYRLVS